MIATPPKLSDVPLTVMVMKQLKARGLTTEPRSGEEGEGRQGASDPWRQPRPGLRQRMTDDEMAARRRQRDAQRAEYQELRGALQEAAERGEPGAARRLRQFEAGRPVVALPATARTRHTVQLAESQGIVGEVS